MEYAGIIISALLLWSGYSAANSKRVDQNGALVLEYTLVWKLFAAASLFFGPAIALYMRSVGKPSPNPLEDTIAQFIVLALFMCCGIPLFLETFFVKIILKGETLITYSPWRKKRRISLRELGSIYYSQSMKWHEIKTKTKGTVIISDLLIGKNSLMQQLSQFKQNESFRKEMERERMLMYQTESYSFQSKKREADSL